MTDFDIWVFCIFIIGSSLIFAGLRKLVRKRFGDHVAQDVPTQFTLGMMSAFLFMLSVEALVFVTGHLVGRL